MNLKIQLFIQYFLLLILFSCGNSGNEEYINNEGLLVTKTYYLDGNLKEEYTSKIEKGDTVTHGYYNEFWQSGNLMLYIETKDGKNHGKFRQYGINGNLIKEVDFSNGLQNGNLKTYFENGKLKSTQSFENNKAEGYSIFYYIDGKIEEISYYKNDVCTGIGMIFFDNENDEIKQLFIKNDKGEDVYRAFYKMESGFSSEEGKPILFTTKLDTSKQFYKTGDSLITNIFYADLPEFEYSIEIGRVENIKDEEYCCFEDIQIKKPPFNYVIYVDESDTRSYVFRIKRINKMTKNEDVFYEFIEFESPAAASKIK